MACHKITSMVWHFPLQLFCFSTTFFFTIHAYSITRINRLMTIFQKHNFCGNPSSLKSHMRWHHMWLSIFTQLMIYAETWHAQTYFHYCFYLLFPLTMTNLDLHDSESTFEPLQLLIVDTWINLHINKLYWKLQYDIGILYMNLFILNFDFYLESFLIMKVQKQAKCV